MGHVFQLLATFPSFHANLLRVCRGSVYADVTTIFNLPSTFVAPPPRRKVLPRWHKGAERYSYPLPVAKLGPGCSVTMGLIFFGSC